MQNRVYQSSEILLSPQDLVLLYTDGLVEVQSKDNELYSSQMLLAAVQKRHALPAAALFDELLNEVGSFGSGAPFSDDVCLVGMDFAGA
jgi:serine phosphatase RsbU (regulator of sigma subunit)